MVTFEYNQPVLQVGVPFTWGVGRCWYIKTDTGIIFNIATGVSNRMREDETCAYPNFRYATKMELS